MDRLANVPCRRQSQLSTSSADLCFASFLPASGSKGREEKTRQGKSGSEKVKRFLHRFESDASQVLSWTNSRIRTSASSTSPPLPGSLLVESVSLNTLLSFCSQLPLAKVVSGRVGSRLGGTAKPAKSPCTSPGNMPAWVLVPVRPRSGGRIAKGNKDAPREGGPFTICSDGMVVLSSFETILSLAGRIVLYSAVEAFV